MSAFTRCVVSDTRRAVCGAGFYVAVACACFSVLQPVWDEARAYAYHRMPGMDIVSLYTLAACMSMQDLLLIAGPAAFSLSFLQDMDDRFNRPLLLRAGRVRYIAARALAVMIASFAAIMLGQIAACLLLRTRVALYLPDGSNHNAIGGSASELLEKGRPVFFLLLRISYRALYVAVMSLFALGVSAYIRNRFMTLFSPFLFSYLYGCMETAFADFSRTRRLDYVINGSVTLPSPVDATLAVLGKCLPLLGLFLIFCAYGMARRLKNE